MKTLFLIITLAGSALTQSIAQSKSFQALENKFSAAENVHSFTTSGFLARTMLWLAGEHEFKSAIKEVKHIRLITIPKSAFADRGVSLEGFKKVVRDDRYEELARARETREEVTVYLQPLKNSPLNRYLILIDNPDEVVAVEIKGYIDVNLLHRKYRQNLTYNP
ncbi:MAG: DUF4252 domain-containing protein [Chryseosolibacter sp.]